jgi:hypothetical protein
VASSAARIHDVDLTVIETTLEVASGTNMRVWAYGGTVPGPVLRATEGDLLRVALTNRTSARHTIHFHGAHDVGQDGLNWSDPRHDARLRSRSASVRSPPLPLSYAAVRVAPQQGHVRHG